MIDILLGISGVCGLAVITLLVRYHRVLFMTDEKLMNTTYAEFTKKADGLRRLTITRGETKLLLRQRLTLAMKHTLKHLRAELTDDKIDELRDRMKNHIETQLID